jgi:hypothetical protein
MFHSACPIAVKTILYENFRKKTGAIYLPISYFNIKAGKRTVVSSRPDAAKKISLVCGEWWH